MKLSEIQRILEAEVIWGTEYLDREITTCFACDLISEMLLYVKPQSLLVTALMNAHIIHTAQVMDAIGVIFVGGKRPDKGVIKNAEINAIPLLTTPYLTFECCGRLFKCGIQADGTKICRR